MEMEKMKDYQKHQEELESLRQSHSAEIQQIKREHQQELDKMKDYYENLDTPFDRKLQQMKEYCEAVYTVYIPKKNDAIDEALARVLNEYPEKEKLKILFLRESEGVYRFGQRRVHLKVEKGNQVLVRVGGGFISAREFIEAFTDVEVDRIERNDVFMKFTEKLMAQKITQNFALEQHERQ